jgi:hypothetical protein
LVPGVLLEAKSNSKKDDAETERDESVNILEKEDKEDEENIEENAEEKFEDNKSDGDKRKYSEDEKNDERIANGDQEYNLENISNKDTDIKEAAKEKDQTDAQASSVSIKKDSESTNKSGTLAQLDSLLSLLPNMINRDLIDQAAVDFCYLNSKASRNKLIKVNIYLLIYLFTSAIFELILNINYIDFGWSTSNKARPSSLLFTLNCNA